jgi:sigma-54 specific flagellar transcriptional regulator A
MTHLMSQTWSGNVRELSNRLERAFAAAQSGSANGLVTIQPRHIEGMSDTILDLPFKEAKLRAMEEWSKATIRHALARGRGNVSQTARKLQMSRTALIRLINRYDLRNE